MDLWTIRLRRTGALAVEKSDDFPTARPFAHKLHSARTHLNKIRESQNQPPVSQALAYSDPVAVQTTGATALYHLRGLHPKRAFRLHHQQHCEFLALPANQRHARPHPEGGLIMNLAEIRNAGGFISPEPVKVPIEWKDYGFDVWVKRLSFGDVETLFNGDDRSRSARMISTAVLLGEDKEPISYDDAYRLDVSLAGKLIEAFTEVNGAPAKN